MLIKFTPQVWDDYRYWDKVDPSKLERIEMLIQDTIKTPFAGRGKPEPLVGDLVGCWSRRIDHQNRLIYKVTDDALIILSVRYHQ